MIVATVDRGFCERDFWSMEIAGDKPLYIMLYKAFGLESGSGYVDTNGNLFVLTAATTLTDATRQQLGVDNS